MSDTHSPPSSMPKSIANAGIRVTPSPQGLLVQPITPEGCGEPATPPFVMPRVFGSVIERTAGISRAFYRRCQRSLAFLLYLNLESHLYQELVPTQVVAPTCGRCTLRLDGVARRRIGEEHE